MIPGHASPEGTARFASRHPQAEANAFFRATQTLTVSSLGIGSYLGQMDEATDQGYRDAVTAAVNGGINFIDTSLNYRNQHSEQAIGQAIAQLIQSGTLRRDEFVICTKAGYLVPNAVPTGVLRASDVVAGMHSMAPAFLEDQIERSRQNLGLETLDVFYLHNPETQLQQLAIEDFYENVRQAFIHLEHLASMGRIVHYGTATWNGYRTKPADPQGLSLKRLAQLAEQVAGPSHRFRYIQFPFNLGMVEALSNKLMDSTTEAGITAIASATLLQARLTRDLPEEIGRRLTGPVTDAQRAIQFTRSTPGISVALVGMSNPAHVQENLGVTTFPPASLDQYLTLYQSA